MSNKNKSLLVDGNIPKNTECPFRNSCPVIDMCNHTGKDHPCDFSCGTARLMDIKQQNKKEI